MIFGPLAAAASALHSSESISVRCFSIAATSWSSSIIDFIPSGGLLGAAVDIIRCPDEQGVIFREKAGGRYADGFFLRLPAQFPVPSRV
jgi:hypothetical protein